jgi:Fe-S-cluster containining protein
MASRKQINQCEKCGICCKLFLINLSEDEYSSGRFQTVNAEFGSEIDFDLAEECGLNILEQKEDGGCIYLEKNGCGIHESRPQVCRNFFCTGTEPEFAGMRRIIIEAKSN